MKRNAITKLMKGYMLAWQKVRRLMNENIWRFSVYFAGAVSVRLFESTANMLYHSEWSAQYCREKMTVGLRWF